MADIPRCAAKSKQTGQRCRQRPTPGMKVCRFHGGKSLKGIANPAFKRGDYSRYAPVRLADKIQVHLADPDVMNLRSEAALLTAQIGETLEVLDVGGVLARWQEIAGLVSPLRRAIEEQDELALVAIADRLDAAIIGASEERGRWGELLDYIDQKRKVVEAQAKVDQRETLSTVEQGLLIAYMTQALALVRAQEDRDAAVTYLNRMLTLEPKQP